MSAILVRMDQIVIMQTREVFLMSHKKSLNGLNVLWVKQKINANTNLLIFAAPKCPIPPDVPQDGVKEHVPLPIEIPPNKLCALDAETVTLSCHSFLRVYITSVTYGRNSSSGGSLCDGEKSDKSLGQGSCYNDEYNKQLQNTYQQIKSSWGDSFFITSQNVCMICDMILLCRYCQNSGPIVSARNTLTIG